jgi:MbtH protein
MDNPFDGEGRGSVFLVLKNAAGQYCLWPSFRGPPAGWIIIGPRGTRERCLEWIDGNWADTRPKSSPAEIGP